MNIYTSVCVFVYIYVYMHSYIYTYISSIRSKRSELCCWLRVCPSLTYDINATMKADREKAISIRSSSEEVKDGDVSGNTANNSFPPLDLESPLLRLCYCRRYPLNQSTVSIIKSGDDGKSHQKKRNVDDTSITSVYSNLVSMALRKPKKIDEVINPSSPNKDRPIPCDLSMYIIFTEEPDVDDDDDADMVTPIPPAPLVVGDDINDENSTSQTRTKTQTVSPITRTSHQYLREPSACGELVGWGLDSAHNLG
jgi:hypothetical protein